MSAGIDRYRLDSAGVEVPTPLALTDHDVLDEQADEGTLLVEVEAVPSLGGHALPSRDVEVGVDDQLVEPSPGEQQASVDRVLCGEELRTADPLRAVVGRKVSEELFVGLDRGDQLLGVAARSTSAGGRDFGVLERGEHVVDDDLLDVVGLQPCWSRNRAGSPCRTRSSDGADAGPA